ncbi:MAG: AAA family ATPase [Anaerolineales bacterium]|nr:AAA family ATPase [Anaerolineales bacterium]
MPTNPTTNLLHGVMKLKTLCVGGHFNQLSSHPQADQFPGTVLSHTEEFRFFVAGSFEKALRVIHQDQDIDLVFVDADFDLLPEITMFITQVREIRPKLPVVVFTSSIDDRMRYLMREGAAWHFTKQSPKLERLNEHIQKHVFSPVVWPDIFDRYASDAVKPRIEPGLSYSDLVALNENPEERYIIKRLFASSDVVQIFRMDEGFSGSRIYRVKPANELRRILKIDVGDRLELIQEKQDALIQPRLNQRVGQIQGKMVRGQHLAGACYALAGSRRDAITLTQFLQDQNRLRKELIDALLEQLQTSLEQLYVGSSDIELRYWAPLYSRVLPPHLTLADARLVEYDDQESTEIVIIAGELTTLSSVPGNAKLQAINEALRKGEEPMVTLCGFEVAELDTAHGVVYVHDDLLAMYPASPLLKSKDHPILRFKVAFSESEWDVLTHPLIRRGKRICVRGRVVESQETILARNIAAITERPYDFQSHSFNLGSGHFISPVTNVRYLLWEIGREDMIVPIPQISPVVHGDLNTTNVLVEAGDTDVSVWLIDFSDARPGHIYFDLAKLEVEFRTHVLFRLYKSMVDEGLWDAETGFKFALLVKDVLWQAMDKDFADFIGDLRDYRPVWYDTLYSQFPLYAENLFYFLFSLRQMAKTYSPERFRYHYPVAVFFQSMAALKFEELENAPWYPWAKRLALCSGLVAGKQAIRGIERPLEVSRVLNTLRARSAFAFITVGSGEERKYLLQWNANWDMFNLVGGRMDNSQGDRDSFARTIQRKLQEELGLQSPRDYRIVWEYKPLYQRQFSQRDFVFKDYEFHVFKIEFLPRHPVTREEYDWLAQRLSSDRENVLVSRAEIERLRTVSNRQISATTRMILHELGEITAEERDVPTVLEFKLDNNHIVVSRGRAQLVGQLVNPRFTDIVENVTIDVLPSPSYEAEKDSAVIQVGAINSGQVVPLTIWLRPREKEARILLRATFYDVRGHEYRQILEAEVYFDSQVRSAFHIDNPYVVGKPLTAASEALYMGREDVFQWIEENLIGKTQPHTLVLYGQRRMGKTSTLYQLVGGHRGKNIREYPNYPIFPVYIDLQRLAGCETTEFFDRLSREIVRNLSRRQINIALPQSWSGNGSIYRDFDDFLDGVEASLPENGLLVLIMDELEQLQVSIERGLLNQDILPYLRSLMQHRTRMTFILVGTNQLVEDYWSIVFHVGISREIVSLTREETERLIRDPVAPMIQYDDLAIDRIWLAARGHPYFSQLICHRLISATNLTGNRSKLISIADVRETFDHIIEEDDSHLLHLWNEGSREEQLVLAALAGRLDQGEEAISRPEIAARLRDVDFADEALNQVLKKLEQRRLISRQPVERELQTRLPRPGGWQPTLISKDYTYSVSFDLLRGWIVSKRPLGSLLD